MEQIQPNSKLATVLAWCDSRKATDLHGQADRALSFRVDGKLERVPHEQYGVPSSDDLQKLLREAFSSSLCDRIEKLHELDISFLYGSARYRANFNKQQGTQAFSFRVVPRTVPNLDDLELPSTVSQFGKEPRGLLLVTGPAGQGKSTTACALLQQLNQSATLRVITVEDPIEYLFVEDKAQFVQREVGVDTDSFANGIRNAMRQDPNVIFIGELRDRDSINAAMQAAETGHLVLATLHADSAPQTMDRIREFYASNEQANASALLARSLNAIICQRLVPSTFGKRIPCLEIMKRSAGVQDAIARNDLHLLAGIIESSINEGMHSFDQYLMQLLKNDYVTADTARHYAFNWNRLTMEMQGFAPSMPGILKPDADD